MRDDGGLETESKNELMEEMESHGDDNKAEVECMVEGKMLVTRHILNA